MYALWVITDKGSRVKQLFTRRKEWMTKINRKKLGTYLFCYACSMHFVGGVATQLLDDTNPAWIPNNNDATKEGDLSCYNRYKRRREQQDNCSLKHTSSFNYSQDEDGRTLSDQKTSKKVLRSDHETLGQNVTNEQPIANYSTTDTLSEDVSMDEIASQIVDEVSFTTMTEVHTVKQQIELDNVLDNDKVKSLQLDNQSLQDEVTELKSRHVPALTMELFENIIRM